MDFTLRQLRAFATINKIPEELLERIAELVR